ncbi:MAG: hypothetical protein KAG66_00340, partial [Methylococcales bacterium]|nr:hypothetical protein [Methylococcales bacterium]
MKKHSLHTQAANASTRLIVISMLALAGCSSSGDDTSTESGDGELTNTLTGPSGNEMPVVTVPPALALDTPLFNTAACGSLAIEQTPFSNSLSTAPAI